MFFLSEYIKSGQNNTQNPLLDFPETKLDFLNSELSQERRDRESECLHSSSGILPILSLSNLTLSYNMAVKSWEQISGA